jgi:NTP pyrophosphatase (non-canonical NTP hydrolase)
VKFDEYERRAARTAIYPASASILYPVVGLANEAGETLGKVKKVLRKDYDYDEIHDALVAELGDCLWYIALAARDLNVNLEDVAKLNLKKLENRALRGTLRGDGDER